jgi:hypothetical protein
MILALAIGIPIILFPAVLVWYLNISGIYTVLAETPKETIGPGEESQSGRDKPIMRDTLRHTVPRCHVLIAS